MTFWYWGFGYVDLTNFIISTPNPPYPRSHSTLKSNARNRSPFSPTYILVNSRNSADFGPILSSQVYNTDVTEKTIKNRRSNSVQEELQKINNRLVLNSLSSKEKSMGNFMQKSYKFHMNFPEKNIRTIRRVIFSKSPGLQVRKPKIRDILTINNDGNLTSRNRPKTTLDKYKTDVNLYAEDQGRITNTYKFYIHGVLNKRNPEFIENLNKNKVFSPQLFKSKNLAIKNTISPQIANLHKTRMQAIYENVLTKAENSKKSAKDLCREYFCDQEIDPKELEKKMYEGTKKDLKMDIISYNIGPAKFCPKKVLVKKIDNINKKDRNISPLEKRQRTKNYKRWYMI